MSSASRARRSCSSRYAQITHDNAVHAVTSAAAQRPTYRQMQRMMADERNAAGAGQRPPRPLSPLSLHSHSHATSALVLGWRAARMRERPQGARAVRAETSVGAPAATSARPSAPSNSRATRALHLSAHAGIAPSQHDIHAASLPVCGQAAPNPRGSSVAGLSCMRTLPCALSPDSRRSPIRFDSIPRPIRGDSQQRDHPTLRSYVSVLLHAGRTTMDSAATRVVSLATNRRQIASVAVFRCRESMLSSAHCIVCCCAG